MNDSIWSNKISENNKGIWSVSCSKSNFNGSYVFSEMVFDNIVVKFFHPIEIEGELLFSSSETKKVEFDSLFLDSVKEAKEFNRLTIKIFIYDFHLISSKNKIAIIKKFRSLHETQDDISVQFVCCGNWGYFDFVREYREIHGLTTSPALEHKNVLYKPNLNFNDVFFMLRRSGVVSFQISEIDTVAINFIIEQTSGDSYLVEDCVKRLTEKSDFWLNNLEQSLIDISNSIDTTKEIKNRIEMLDDDCLKELDKLIRVHKLIRNYDSIITEKLWLSGLISKKKLPASKEEIVISCPIISTVIRNNTKLLNLTDAPTSKDICFSRNSISSSAYLQVAEIENLLRNIVVSEWYHKSSSSDWSENLKNISEKISDRDPDVDFIAQIISVLDDHGYMIKRESIERKNETSSSKNKNYLEISKDWQKRQTEHYNVSMGECNVMHFLTTGNLSNALLHKRFGLVGDGKPFNKNELLTMLESFKFIRSAVAHNQPILIDTLITLNTINKQINDWLTVYIDNNY